MFVAKEHFDEFCKTYFSGPIGVTTPYTLLRPAFESSLWAIWLLDPDSYSERLKRAIAIEANDLRNRDKYLEDLSSFAKLENVDPGPLPSWQVTLLRELEALGSDLLPSDSSDHDVGRIPRKKDSQTRLPSRPNLIGEIDNISSLPSLLGNQRLLVEIRIQWRFLSGYEHGMSWALVFGSDHADEVEDSFGIQSTISASSEQLTESFATCILLYRAAQTMYLFRSGLLTDPRTLPALRTFGGGEARRVRFGG